MPKSRTIQQLLDMYDALVIQRKAVWAEQERIIRELEVPELSWNRPRNDPGVHRAALINNGPRSLIVLHFRQIDFNGNLYIGVDRSYFGGPDDYNLAKYAHPEWVENKPGSMELLSWLEEWKLFFGYTPEREPLVLEHERLSLQHRQLTYRSGTPVRALEEIVRKRLEDLKIGPYYPTGDNRYRIQIGDRILSMTDGRLRMKDLGSTTVMSAQDKTIEPTPWHRMDTKVKLKDSLRRRDDRIKNENEIKQQSYKTAVEVFLGS